MTIRIDHVVTSGTFSLDGQDFDVDNNVWVVGDDHEAVVIDPAHTAQPILDVVGGRRLLAVLCTHGHNDHITAAPEVAAAAARRTGDPVPVKLHPADRMLWDAVHPGVDTEPFSDGEVFRVGGAEFTVLHTPGHSPGAVCLSAPSLEVVFSGDTLFQGGPGATGRSFSSFPDILDSIRTRLLTLPAQTRVLTGHGDETTIGAEAKDYDAWVARGH